jgi:hypothetical protein
MEAMKLRMNLLMEPIPEGYACQIENIAAVDTDFNEGDTLALLQLVRQ